MKPFAKFLTESKKQYAFRVKLACECSADQLADLKTALDKYSVAAMSQPKETPIAETHANFPHLKNVKLTIIDILTDYPANPVQIREMVRDVLAIAESHIMVTNAQQEADALPVPPVGDEPILTKEYEKSVDPSILVDLKKILDSHESRKYEFAANTDAKGDTTNDIPQYDKSVLGSHKTTTPKART